VRAERAEAKSGQSAKKARTCHQRAGAAGDTPSPAEARPDLEFVRSLATLEVSPLRQCTADDREALKKKILLKWHPDKQPSAEHKCLATQVMQELQNCAEWKAQGK